MPKRAKNAGAAKLPRSRFSISDSVDRLAQEIVAALGHRFVGGHEVLAVGGGTCARVRDSLHGAPAEIGLVVIKGGWGDAFASRSKVPRRAGRNAPSEARVAEARSAEPVGGASRRARTRQFCRVLASLN